MTDVPADLLHRLRVHRQDHLLGGWERLAHADRMEFVARLAAIDFAELVELARQRGKPADALDSTRIAPLPVTGTEVTAQERAAGEESLGRGEVAALVVAGGQGSRLGFDKPKGMFAVGPLSGASLFRINAEKLLALGRRYRKPIPFLVMTSLATDADTRDYFREHRFFGLDPADVIFFRQGTMPAVCAHT